MVKVCLHNHTFRSKFSINTLEDFRKIMLARDIDIVAITDHDYLNEAKIIQKELGEDRVIIGQEISTKDGDIIGLFLKKFVPSGTNAERVCQHIKSQGGLVYIPHPFDKKNGISKEAIEKLKPYIDIVEVSNGWRFKSFARPFLNSKLEGEAEEWAKKNNKLIFSSSDSHYPTDIGSCYVEMESFSDATSFMRSLSSPDINLVRRKNKINLLSVRTFIKGLFRKDILRFIK